MRVVVTDNSTYEVDEENRLVRRVGGKSEPTQRFTPDGEWKAFVRIDTWGWNGDQLLVEWPDDNDDLSPYTVTSPVADDFIFEGAE